MSDDHKFSYVHFRYDQAGTRIGWGHLTIVDGVPWMASSETDAKENPPRIWKMHRLDPRLLEKESSSPGERQMFAYRGELSARS